MGRLTEKVPAHLPTHVLIAAIALAALTGLVAMRLPESVNGEPDMRTTRDIAAYVQISADMLADDEAEEAASDRAPLGGAVVIGSADQAVGRYTLASIEAGSAIAEEQLGPWLPEGALTERALLSIEVAASRALSRAIKRGSEVTLLLSPKEPGETTQVDGVLVLDWDDAEEGPTYILAVPADRLDDIGRVLASATPSLVRQPIPPPRPM